MIGTLAPLPARNGLVERLAQQISALIRREQLRPGDRLPSARALADRYGVAVPTLREAIRRLEAFGEIEIRHGAGIFVRAARPRVMLANPGLGEIDGRTVLDLLETRLLIEPHVCELAARAGDAAALGRLSETLAEAERHLDGDDRVLQRANMAFHAGIAQCSGNLVLTHVLESLIELYSPEQAAMLSLGNARRRDHQEHQAILAAIRVGDARQARTLMRRHLLGVKKLMAVRLNALAHAAKADWLDGTAGAGHPWPAADGEPRDRAPVPPVTLSTGGAGI